MKPPDDRDRPTPWVTQTAFRHHEIEHSTSVGRNRQRRWPFEISLDGPDSQRGDTARHLTVGKLPLLLKQLGVWNATELSRHLNEDALSLAQIGKLHSRRVTVQPVRRTVHSTNVSKAVCVEYLVHGTFDADGIFRVM